MYIRCITHSKSRLDPPNVTGGNPPEQAGGATGTDQCSPGPLGRRTRPQTLGMTGTDQLERLPHGCVPPIQ